MADHQRGEAERPGHAGQQRNNREKRLDDTAERDYEQYHEACDGDYRGERHVVLGCAFFCVGEGRAAGHPGVDVRKLRAYRVHRALDNLDRIRLAGGAVGRGDMQEQVLAVVRDEITVAQDTVLIPGGSEPVPR